MLNEASVLVLMETELVPSKRRVSQAKRNTSAKAFKVRECLVDLSHNKEVTMVGGE